MKSPRYAAIFASISIPVLLICIFDLIVGTEQKISGDSIGRLNFLGDLVFLNNVHVFFSFFLFYVAPPFRSVYENVNVYLVSAFTAVLVAVLVITQLNAYTLPILSIIHAFSQSIGIYLLFFFRGGSRASVKWLLWSCLLILILRSLGVIELPALAWGSIGVMVTLFLSYKSQSFLGALFAARFFVWFVPFSINGFCLAAIHGLEYLFIVILLIKENNIVIKPSDIPFAIVCLAIPCSYATYTYLFNENILISLFFYFGVYLHYMFDSYSFRFSLFRPRKYILPLFSKS